MKLAWLFSAFVLLAPFSASAESMSDADVRQAMIQESIGAYPGNCPCPYNHASNGSRCGKRSAWSRAGGYAPRCYPEDVTDAMVKQYRESHGIPK
jgi:hypothetical protein